VAADQRGRTRIRKRPVLFLIRVDRRKSAAQFPVFAAALTPSTRAFGRGGSSSTGSRDSYRPTLPARSLASTRRKARAPASRGIDQRYWPSAFSPLAITCHGPSSDAA